MSLLGRLGSWVRRSQEDAEMDEELRFHLEMETEQNVRAGMDPAQARRRATVDFGGVERWREHIREARAPLALEGFVRDLRRAGRALRRSPAFLVGAVLALGLGIGSNAAILSALRAILFAAPPLVEDAGSLIVIREVEPVRGARGPVSEATFTEWRERVRTVTAIAGVQRLGTQTLRLADVPESVNVQAVSPGFFDVLGVAPQLGREFADADASAASRPVAIVSASFLERRLGSDANVIGRELEVGGTFRTIVGVTPRGFGVGGDTEVWVPMASGGQGVDATVLTIARRRPGLGDAEIAAELSALRPEPTAGASEPRPAVVVEGLRGVDGLGGGGMQPGYVMLIGAAALSLLVTCANLALLTVARGLRKRQERGLMAALGASRARIVRGQLAEGVLLAGAGGAVSVLLAQGVVRLFSTGVDPATALALRMSLDLQVYAVVGVLVVLTGAVCGLLPTLALPADVLGSLRGTSGWSAARPARIRRGLVIAEIALTTMLGVATALLAKGALDLAREDPGFDRRNVLAVRIDAAGRVAAGAGWDDDLLQRVRALPGVRAASVTGMLPHGVVGRPRSITAEGGAASLSAIVNEVGSDYFGTLGLTSLNGDARAALEGPGGVVLSRALAEALWPGASPLGRTLRLEGDSRAHTVTAVVSDVSGGAQRSGPQRVAYLPWSELPSAAPVWVIVRTESDAMALAPFLRAAAAELFPQMPLANITTLENLAGIGTAEVAAAAAICMPLVLLALLLAASGVYGLIAEAVEVRRRELGIRAALGARGSQLVRMLLEGGLTLAGSGLALGLVGVFVLDRVLENLFYGVAASQPLVLAGTALLMLATATAASGLPALRALKVGPATALRLD